MEYTQNKAQKNVELGALWKREARSSGQKYLAGHVKVDELGVEVTKKVVIFANKHKTKDTQPDFRIYEAMVQAKPEPQEAETQETEVPAATEQGAEDDLL